MPMISSACQRSNVSVVHHIPTLVTIHYQFKPHFEMKRTYIFNIIILTLLFSLCSCDDWLEPKSEVDPERNVLLDSPEGVEDAFTGIYASLSHKDLYGRALTYYIPSILAGHYGMVGKDIEHWMKYPYDRTSMSYNDLAIIDIDRIWSKLYNLIANTNSIIEFVEKKDPQVTDVSLRRAKGEALGLRAFMHFELLRYFGIPYSIDADAVAIPYMDKLTSVAGQLRSQREVIELIINDLKEAERLTADDTESSRLRFGHTAVLATLARVYLYSGQAYIAHDYAVRAINERPSYISWHNMDAADGDRLLESELIFALNVSRLNEYAAGWILPGGVGRKNTIMVITQAGEYYYDDEDDIRKSLWVASIGYDRYCGKFDLSSQQPLMPVIRLSEMAYMAAEGASTGEEALEYLNMVRIHRGLHPFSSITDIDLKNELQKEYQREFICEGQLWHYYKRNLVTNIPGNSNFRGRLNLFTFPLPEDELIFGNPSK